MSQYLNTEEIQHPESQFEEIIKILQDFTASGQLKMTKWAFEGVIKSIQTNIMSATDEDTNPLYYHGYSAGRDVGHNEGYDEGYDDGYNYGYEAGYNDGREDGA